ncbi:hypothetical protein SHELI_v1c08980 [Spiroplasma helicoides]|uniref:Uncharacterized protein n=1 Tax=Spiroplasma helicoides TaxID=216938 RepID=A0A1B3SLQ5_9MOLU|nr:hypothetical protein [Spiroplasma helicoides]AOG60847.1 hypothetical protein SHELI_v1c08980 [Spiroplasma helicoides]
MTKDQFLDKWTDLEYVNSEASVKVVSKESGKSVIWVMPKNNNVGLNTSYGVSLELLSDFIELMKTEIKVW